MSKLALAVLAGALAVLTSPASAQHSGHGHRQAHAQHGHHQSHGHRQAHVQHRSHHGHHVAHAHAHHKPAHHVAHVQHHHVAKPIHHAPVHAHKHFHAAPVHVHAPRPVYVQPKLANHCFEVIKPTGYGHHQKVIVCKPIETHKIEHKTVEHKVAQAEPAPVQVQVETPVEDAPQR